MGHVLMSLRWSTYLHEVCRRPRLFPLCCSKQTLLLMYQSAKDAASLTTMFTPRRADCGVAQMPDLMSDLMSDGLIEVKKSVLALLTVCMATSVLSRENRNRKQLRPGVPSCANRIGASSPLFSLTQRSPLAQQECWSLSTL